MIVRLPSAKAATIGGRGAGATRIGWPGLDRDPNRPGELFPELDCRRVRLAPLLNDRLDLVVRARVVRHDPAPRPDRTAEAGGEFAALAELPLCRRDLGVLRLMQHPARDNLVRLEPRVAGPLERGVGVEFPLLAGEPGQHHGFDG